MALSIYLHEARSFWSSSAMSSSSTLIVFCAEFAFFHEWWHIFLTKFENYLHLFSFNNRYFYFQMPYAKTRSGFGAIEWSVFFTCMYFMFKITGQSHNGQLLTLNDIINSACCVFFHALVWWLFSQLTVSNIFQEHYQIVKWFAPRSGQRGCRSWSEFKLFAKVIRGHQTSPLARKGVVRTWSLRDHFTLKYVHEHIL